MNSIENQPFGLGAIYTEDTRDYKYEAGIATPEILPIPYATDTSMFPVLMQGKQEACVSYALVRLMQIYWYKKTGKVVNFSPRFLHAITSAGTSDTSGRDPRVIASVLVNTGCCTTGLLPDDTSLSLHDYSFAPITQAMLDEAAQYKIPAYSFPTTDSYSIRHAIYHKGGVGLLFQVGDEWWVPSWQSKDINPLRAPKIVVSGHEVAGEHWNELDGFENSWSDLWDEKGYGEYESGYHPIQVICIDDPSIDFNPDTIQLQQTINQEENTVKTINDPTIRQTFWNLIISQIKQLFGIK